MPATGNRENITRKWKRERAQPEEQRSLQFLIQTKHFDIPNSLGFPLTVTESFQNLLGEGFWCSGCPKSTTIIWCKTTAKVSADKWQDRLQSKLHPAASWWRTKTSGLAQLAGILEKLSLPREPTENFLLSLVFIRLFIAHTNFLHERPDQLWWQRPNWNFLQTLARVQNGSKCWIAEIQYSDVCFV